MRHNGSAAVAFPRSFLRVFLLVGLTCAGTAIAQPAATHQSRWEFTQVFIRDTWLHPIRSVDVTIAGAGPVHDPPNDCEIHIGAELEDQSVSDFAGLVLEPPNVCKDARKSQSAWRTFYSGMAGKSCVGEGFIRAWPEHLTSGQGASNPPHIMELHPLRKLSCPGSQIDVRNQLAAHSDLGYKTASQVETVLRTFRLWVRTAENPDSEALNTVQFDYYVCTATANGQSCGYGKGVPNFARLKVSGILTTKRCSGGGENGEEFRTIIGRARSKGPTGPVTSRGQLAKFYALPGTTFYTNLGDNCSPAGPPTKKNFDVLGIFTVDPLAVVKTLDRVKRDHLEEQWVEVSFPTAFVVFDEIGQ